MSKDKSLDTIMYHGKGKFNGRHNVPREFLQVYEKLEELNFVNCVGLGKFRQTKKQKGLKITGFDICKNSYVLNIIGKKYEQKIFLNVNKRDENYEVILENIF